MKSCETQHPTAQDRGRGWHKTSFARCRHFCRTGLRAPQATLEMMQKGMNGSWVRVPRTAVTGLVQSSNSSKPQSTASRKKPSPAPTNAHQTNLGLQTLCSLRAQLFSSRSLCRENNEPATTAAEQSQPPDLCCCFCIGRVRSSSWQLESFSHIHPSSRQAWLLRS